MSIGKLLLDIGFVPTVARKIAGPSRLVLRGGGLRETSDGQEWNAFVSEIASGGGVLAFGRIAYELLASY